MKILTRSLRAILSLAILIAAFPASAQIFYKVEGNGLATPSYLFGTHHMAPADFLDSFKQLPEVMEQTQAVVGEIDMTGNPMQLQMDMAPYMMAPSDSTLSQLVTPEVLADMSAKFKPLAPMEGMELAMFEPMRPMVVTTIVSLTMVQKSMPGFDPSQQLDMRFQKLYKEAGKKVIPLETAKQQAELLYCSVPIARQLETLRESLDNPEKIEQQAEKLNASYIKQDLDALFQLTREEDDQPEFMIALLDRRNHNWMQQLPSIMSEQPSLIVVGALHLAGEEGLVNLLRSAGYTVTPVE
ncbi:MAG: TraB/GumN family protein [Muribaculaceae bacterium]|nr:TraB/GumN family protein [Muribaculaceae bacterium]